MAPKVILTHDTPSGSVVKEAQRLIHVTDARGRKLGLRQPSFLEEFKIIETAGPELAANGTYMAMLNPLLFLVEIDGAEVQYPRSKLQIDALIQFAGRDGFTAVLEGITKHFAANGAEVENKIKNGDGTPA